MYPEEMARLLNAGDDYHDPLADAVSKPTKPYVEMSFGMGKDGYPSHQYDPACSQQVLSVAQRQDRPLLSPTHRGGVGICLQGWHHNRFLVWR